LGCRYIHALAKRHSPRSRDSARWLGRIVPLMLRESRYSAHIQKLTILNRKRFFLIGKGRHTFMASSLFLYLKRMRLFLKGELPQRNQTMKTWKKTKTMVVFPSALSKLMRSQWASMGTLSVNSRCWALPTSLVSLDTNSWQVSMSSCPLKVPKMKEPLLRSSLR
jgi:hypothetical protein